VSPGSTHVVPRRSGPDATLLADDGGLRDLARGEELVVDVCYRPEGEALIRVIPAKSIVRGAAECLIGETGRREYDEEARSEGE
jgi:hypothetical protein